MDTTRRDFWGLDSMPNNPMYHKDGIKGGRINRYSYPFELRDGLETSVWQFRHRPWLAQCHEYTFLNRTVPKNKAILPKPLHYVPTNGVVYGDHPKVIEGFSKGNDMQMCCKFIFAILLIVLLSRNLN